MPPFLAALLLWGAAAAAVTGQVMILRSSRRVLKRTDAPRPIAEWAFAIGPALVLAIVLVLSWQAATRPATLRMDVTPGVGELRS